MLSRNGPLSARLSALTKLSEVARFASGPATRALPSVTPLMVKPSPLARLVSVVCAAVALA